MCISMWVLSVYEKLLPHFGHALSHIKERSNTLLRLSTLLTNVTIKTVSVFVVFFYDWTVQTTDYI